MILSADPGTPGYFEYAEIIASGKDVKVLVNGVEVKNVISLDTEKGWFKYYVTDADGKVLVDPNNPDQAWITTQENVKVTVEFIERAKT